MNYNIITQTAKSTLISIAMFLCILLIVIIQGCNGAPCCPEIEYFYTQEEWICPNCPDAGARLFYKIHFTELTENGKKDCDSKEVQLMGLRNLTDNSGIHPDGKFIKTGTGIYENAGGGTFIQVSKTSTIRLTVTGEEGCDAANKEVTIRVVTEGDSQKICFPHNDLPWPQGLWKGTTNIFGTGVIVHSIKNPNLFDISVTHNGITATNLKPSGISAIHRGQTASGSWAIQIDDKTEYQKFIQSSKELCVIVFLSCKCP